MKLTGEVLDSMRVAKVFCKNKDKITCMETIIALHIRLLLLGREVGVHYKENGKMVVVIIDLSDK